LTLLYKQLSVNADTICFAERHYLGTNISLLTQTEAEWSITDSPILWLGVQASSGQWHYPYQLSYLNDEITQNDRLLSKFVHGKRLKRGINSTTIPCKRYQTEDYYSSKYQRQAEKSCVLSFVIPGFMKAGTTYLFDIITKHPQVLLTLKGVAYKESGCYYREATSNHRSHNRMNCFPFVEDHEVSYIFSSLNTCLTKLT
jgi:hypothetical protein